MNEIKVFDYNENKVRTVLIDGEPWWVLKDVCDVLEIGNSRMVADRLDNDEKDDVSITDAIGRQQNTTVINESGLYSTILLSRKPEAKQFKCWITHEVLPSIRKTGMYATQETAEKLLNDPDFLIEALLEIKSIREKNAVLNGQVKEMAPKAEFFDAVADSNDAIDIGSAAKVLNMGIGRNELFKFLRNKAVLMSNNLPYQEFVDRGYFRSIEQKYTKPDGSTHINIKTLVYQKGLQHIRKLYNKSIVGITSRKEQLPS